MCVCDRGFKLAGQGGHEAHTQWDMNHKAVQGDKTLSLMELTCEGQSHSTLSCAPNGQSVLSCGAGGGVGLVRGGGGDKWTHSLNRINQRTVNTHTSHRLLKHVLPDILKQSFKEWKEQSSEVLWDTYVCLLDPGHSHGEKVKFQKSFLQRTEAGGEASRNRLSTFTEQFLRLQSTASGS